MGRLTKAAAFVSSFFGLGFLPWAPGTWGTVGAAVVAWLVPAGRSWPITISAIFATSCVLSLILGSYVEGVLSVKDPKFFVLDEVAGFMITVDAPVKPGILWFVGGFLLFRIFDVVKPWPCRRLERMRGGTGILMDDLMAGVYAAAVLMLSRWLFGWPT